MLFFGAVFAVRFGNMQQLSLFSYVCACGYLGDRGANYGITPKRRAIWQCPTCWTWQEDAAMAKIPYKANAIFLPK